MSVSLLYFSVILFELHYGSFAVQLQSGQSMSLKVRAHTHCNVYVHTFPCDNILGEEGFPPPPPTPPSPGNLSFTVHQKLSLRACKDPTLSSII